MMHPEREFALRVAGFVILVIVGLVLRSSWLR